MFLTWNVHYLKLRRQKNMKNVVEVLEVGDSDRGEFKVKSSYLLNDLKNFNEISGKM